MEKSVNTAVCVKVVGVGGGGGNAISRMAEGKARGLELIAINTDVQALRMIGDFPTIAIGPSATGGMGSGGDAEVGRKAMRESSQQVAQLLEGADLVFITAGMGGGTGTGAVPVVAEIAKKQGALTVAVVTTPFSFEGILRREVAAKGLALVEQKVDTLITVENDRLLSSLDGSVSLDKAFRLTDEVLRQGVQGISEIITEPGLVNVDFADVKAVMKDAGRSFMSVGEGRGKSAATDAVRAALSNPLFDAPIKGAEGVLLNIRGGKDLQLGQVQEVASVVRDATQSQTRIIFGVVKDPKWKRRVSVTLVATGVEAKKEADVSGLIGAAVGAGVGHTISRPPKTATNGRTAHAVAGVHKML